MTDQVIGALHNVTDADKVLVKEGKTIWELYKESRIVKIDLGEFDEIFTGRWVIVHPTSSFEPAIAGKIDKIEGEMEQARYAMRMWIKDWNIPGHDGETPLPLPSEDSNEWEDVIPLEMQSFIVKKIGEIDEKRVNVPTQSDSEQSQQ